jgi:hypothetical protein
MRGSRWDSGRGISVLQGQYCVKYRSKVTAQMVFSIRNLTTRRDAISIVGIDKLIKQGGGKSIQQDDFGTLWKLPTDGRDPHMIYVEVVNSTPQMDSDGEYVVDKKGDYVYDHYFLRVPHTVTTAKAAVAWTVQEDVDEFVGFVAES